MIPALAYWQAVAKGIDAEDQKASLFVRHPSSLGGAREVILRNLITHQTPEPFRVSSGFVCKFAGAVPVATRQCDVLVYDPRVTQPYYAIDSFVVVSQPASRLVVEVKSNFGQDDLDEMCQVAQSTKPLGIPTLGFAFEGWTFDTAVQKVADAVGNDPKGIPDCIAVHRRNYVIFRPRLFEDEVVPFTAFDFSGLGAEAAGLATAILLDIADIWTRHNRPQWAPPEFFATLDGSKVAGAVITPKDERRPYSFSSQAD